MANSNNGSNRKDKVIKGFKTFGKGTVKYVLQPGAKYSLKALAKIPEIALTGSSTIINTLAKSESMQSILTTGGLIAASVACPPIAVGSLGLVAAKYLGYKLTGEQNAKGQDKGIVDALRETIALGNILTNKVCSQVITPTMDFINTNTQELGSNAQSKIDHLFDER